MVTPPVHPHQHNILAVLLNNSTTLPLNHWEQDAIASSLKVSVEHKVGDDPVT